MDNESKEYPALLEAVTNMAILMAEDKKNPLREYMIRVGSGFLSKDHTDKDIWMAAFATGYGRALADVLTGALNLELFQPERR